MSDLWLPFAIWGATIVFVLVAAKAHGRQIRLERERAGFMSVDFRAKNPPFVEALWRRDRRRFWSFFVIVGVLSSATWYFGPFAAGTEGWGGLGLRIAWSFGSAFVFAGLRSFAAYAKGADEGDTAQQRALWVSAGLWICVAALAGLLFWLWRL